MMINVLHPMMLLKGHGVYTYHPSGPAFLRNPPAQHFRSPEEPDIPAFAHDGHGNHDEGQFMAGPFGEMVYQSPRGEFRHGIDAVIHGIGRFLASHGDRTDPKAIVDKAIRQFNEKHPMADNHGLKDSNNMSWRKIRVAPLHRGSGHNIPTKTHNGTQITHLHNKNPDTAPMGKFIESAYMPIHRELFDVLTNIMGYDAADVKSMSFTKYPYVYAHDLAPNTYGTAEDHATAEIPDKYRRFAPEGYFPDMESVHSWEVAHHLPKVMHYPKIGKRGKPPIALKRAAHQYIEEAMQQGIEHIPDVPIQINRGSVLQPDLVQVGMREALQNPGLREELINDVAKSPSLMFLFGRSGQGDMKKLMDYFTEQYGAGEDGLTLDQQMQYLTGGSSGGGAGTHTSAARLMALSRKSGKTEDGQSHMGAHEITPEEMGLLKLTDSPMAHAAADRYQTIVEALANHQASARGHQVQRELGDIPESPMMNASIMNFPQIDPETGLMTTEGLDPHMDAYMHRVEDYAPTTPSEERIPGVLPGKDAVMQPDAVPVEEQLPPPRQVMATGPSSLGTTPPVARPQPQPIPPVAVAPKPLHPAVQQAREPVGRFNPEQLREFMQAAGMRHPQLPPAEGALTPHERRFQQAFSDPHQTMLDQFMRSEDAHLPIMERVLKQLERIQMADAKQDVEILKHQKRHFNDSRHLAKHLNLTTEDVISISHSTGDWHRIAKTYNVEPKIVKVIKINTGGNE